jgi:hypothetical protein
VNAHFAIGDTRVNTDGYIDRKISEDKRGSSNWRPLHRILWEDAHGPVPPGHIVTFKDGEKLHCVLDNLELITYADNLRRNSIWKTMPKELAIIAQLRGVITRAINKRLGRNEVDNRGRRNAERRAIRNAKKLARQRSPDGHRESEGGGSSC